MHAHSSVVLLTPEGAPVDNGAAIPLDQILAGPAQPRIHFSGADVRGIGDTIREENRMLERRRRAPVKVQAE